MANAKQAPENFDEFYNGNNAFILGGITFHWRPLHWREWGETIDNRVTEAEQDDKRRRELIEELVSGGKTLEDAENDADNAETLVSSFEKVIDRICVYLEPGEIESFKAVVNDTDKRVTIAQLNGLQVWLQEVQTPDRPTTAPVLSSTGRGAPGATS